MTLAQDFDESLAVCVEAWQEYQSVNRQDLAALRVAAIAFEESWQALKAAHRALNQSTPFRLDCWGKR